MIKSRCLGLMCLKLNLIRVTSPYSVIAQKDRTSGEHGGVFIATKNSFALNYSILSYDADYCIGLSIYSGAVNHIFLLIYNPPASSQFRIPAKMLTDSIRYFNCKLINGSSSYTILGDLNLPDICWASSDGGCDYSKLVPVGPIWKFDLERSKKHLILE